MTKAENDCCKLSLKKTQEKTEEKTTASQTAAKENSVDAAVVTINVPKKMDLEGVMIVSKYIWRGQTFCKVMGC